MTTENGDSAVFADDSDDRNAKVNSCSVFYIYQDTN